MTRPAYTFDRLPECLRAEKRWLMWRYETRKGKKTKVPYSVYGGMASSTDPKTWTDFDLCEESMFRMGADGIGFCLGAGWVGLDIDHAVTDGVLGEQAKAMCDRLKSYTELSPSRAGVHVILRGELAIGEGRKVGGIELYGNGRYFTMTGYRIDGYPADVIEPTDFDGFKSQYFPKKEKPKPADAPSANSRTDFLKSLSPAAYAKDSCPDDDGFIIGSDTWTPPTDLSDDELIRLIQNSKGGANFWALYAGNWTALYSSQSEADLALCGTLAFWTGCDATRIDRIFRQSALMRGKWDARRGECTYGERTIRTVIQSRA